MSMFKCKMCGGTIEFEQGATIGICDSCGTKQTLPRLDDDKKANLYDRADHFRRNNDFDKAAAIYEQILNEDTTDAEAYWSLVLCQYGIEYVEDPATHKRVPTVNRAQFTSVFDDDNYKLALQYADGYQRELYEKEAETINDIQKGILAISQKEEPFDVFICYKETDNNGRRTLDSVLANDLYYLLTQEGFKVFFARITLEDKLGSAYEPYIFAALNSAKVMVVLGTRPEHFDAVWVKNEWSRYLALVKKSGGKKILIPAYRDMDPYDLPEEFSHLQAQDMSKLGFMQDLIRGIKKIAEADEPKAMVRETVVVGSSNANVISLLERAFLFLEDGKWQDANTYCEKVLDIAPKNAEAYLGKLMADLRVKTRKQLADCSEPFDGRDNYGKVIRFGDEKIKTEMRGYITHINDRNENARLTAIYNGAVNAMNTAKNEAEYKSAAERFKTIPGFKDADALAEQCLGKAEICRKNAEKAAKKLGGIIAITTSIVVVWLVLTTVIIPGSKYNAAVKLMNNGKYDEAISAFEALGEYKDSKMQIENCNTAIKDEKYNAAMNLYNAGKYNEAMSEFEALGEYKDSKMQIDNCNTAIKDEKYNAAMNLYNAGKYNEAMFEFEALGEYKDSKMQIENCKIAIKYNAAMNLYNAGKYSEAMSAFEALGEYKDSKMQVENCKIAIKYDEKYNAAMSLYNAGKVIEAYEALLALNGYRDSADKANSIYPKYEIEKLKAAKVGDYVFFGSYEQDNNPANGKESIEWLVLAKEGDKALVISRYALDCQRYNTSAAYVTWDRCSLRKWLNVDFIGNAFSPDEQNMIRSTTVTADRNPSYYDTYPGINTTDKVFLLSITETIKYFRSMSACQCQGTAYCYAQGAHKASNGNCWWWLRSPGDSQGSAAHVYDSGSTRRIGLDVDDSSVAVRPALWINLGA